MKAEHRHRLEANALADRVGRVVQTVKSAPATQSLALWLGVLAIVIVIVAWQLFRSAAYTETSTLWRTLDAATENPGDVLHTLENIQDEHAGTSAGTAAGYLLARMKLQEGQTNLGNTLEIDRKEAIKKLVSAREMYAKLAKDSSDAPLLAQEALMMQAKIDESLIGVPNPEKAGDVLSTFEQAKNGYQALATKYPDSPAGIDAKKRLDDLEKNKTEIEKFYTDYNNQLSAPRPTSPIGTLPGINTPTLPPLPANLQNKPPIDLTPKPEDKKPPITLPKAGDAKSTGAPAAGDKKAGAADSSKKAAEPIVPKLGDNKSSPATDKKK